MAYTRTTWANGSGGGTPMSAANLNNIEVELVALDLLIATLAPATTLPGSPVNGQLAILTDSTTTPTYQWMFRYNTTISDANKWQFVGGVAAEAEVATSEAIASATYVDAATAGPSVTVPCAGVYLISFGCTHQADTNITNTRYVSPKIGSAATSDTDSQIISVSGGATNQLNIQPLGRTIRKTLAASDVIKLQYRGSGAGSAAVSNRWLSIIPVRVA